MLGYLGRIDGLGLVNLGLQKASFRGSSHTGTLDTRERENPWLYNASIGIEITPDLLLYGGTQRGLEDLGSAPERAINRNEQLPPARSTQYEAGLSWHFGLGHAVVSLFQITKPYYSFDANDRYALLGTVRHRGIEGSLSGHFFDKRLTLLIGAMVMKPEVSGPGVEQGLVGKRPVGTRGVRVSFDANYRTDFLNGFTPTFGFTYRGKTVAVSRPYNDQGDQLILGARSEVNLGFRQPVKLGRYPATILGKVDNLFDEKHWLAIASKTLIMSDRRRFTLALLVDF
jgi:iron complex outermembrane receptor protein